MKAGVHEPTYRSWQMMKNRCTNPRAADYRYYGGRGIFLAPSWFEYDGFLADMGERPDGLTLERVLSDGWYTKGNCCWASRLTQARNREYTLDLTFGDRTMKVWEWPTSSAWAPWRFITAYGATRTGVWPGTKYSNPTREQNELGIRYP